MVGVARVNNALMVSDVESHFYRQLYSHAARMKTDNLDYALCAHPSNKLNHSIYGDGVHENALESDLNIYRTPQLHNVQSHFFFFTLASQLVLYGNEKNKRFNK